MAAAAGVAIDVARRWKASLVAKGLVNTSPRVVPGIGRRADIHDLSGLFARLEALALEEALAEAHADLPVAAYHQGPATIPQLSTGRPELAGRGPPTKSTARAPTASWGRDPTITWGRAPTMRTGETETISRKPDREPDRRTQQSEPGSTTNLIAATRPEEYSQADGSALEHQERARTGQDRAGPTGYFDPGIASAIERHVAEFGDDDVDRTNEAVHHLWWNTKLPRRSVHRALKRAYYATRAKQRDGMIRSWPMAYYLGAVVNALAAACEEAGLPPPAGWKAPAGAPARGRRRAGGATG